MICTMCDKTRPKDTPPPEVTHRCPICGFMCTNCARDHNAKYGRDEKASAILIPNLIPNEKTKTKPEQDNLSNS